jgi:hypothetical protein
VARRPQPDAVEVEPCGLAQAVTLRGRHDERTMPLVEEALDRALTAPAVNGARLVIVDLCPVDWCDGALPQTLVAAHDRYCDDGDTVLVLAVRRSSSVAGRTLASAGACDVIPTFAGREAAMAALEVAYLEALWAYSARRG